MERAEHAFRQRRFVRDARKRFAKDAARPSRASRVERAAGFRRASRLVLFAVALSLVYAQASRTAPAPYALADDCPRGALVYAQFADLPALVKEWDDSRLKERYLASTNFKQFQTRHLALKLLERWQEFNNALGFPLDTSALTTATEQRAALAVYDIGRLEAVFVAPLGEEKAAAARFFQNAADFDQTELPDGSVYYSREVEADRGRQHQKLLFANARGRFVLATSEQLMLRTLANINRRSRKDSLADDPSFKALSRDFKPHTATAWVDQTRLNEDWYFKHYWAMGNVEQLKEIRAGIFDFEVRAGSWLERREFLLSKKSRSDGAARQSPDLRRLAAMMPEEAAYARTRLLVGDGAKDAAQLIDETLLDRLPLAEQESDVGGPTYDDFNISSGDDDSDDWAGSRYTYLGEEYDQTINDAEEADDVAEQNENETPGTNAQRTPAGIEQLLRPARPLLAATAESPHVAAGPLFAEFRRTAIIRLGNPERLDPHALETAVASLIARRLTVAVSGANLLWTDAQNGRQHWRELELPMLGWKLCYTLKGTELIVANSSELISATLSEEPSTRRPTGPHDFTPDDLTVIRFNRRAEAFNRVFDKLDAARVKNYWKERGANPQAAIAQSSDAAAQSSDTTSQSAAHVEEASGPQQRRSEEFFSGNVASLLDVASSVNRVEIRRRTAADRLQVEVEMFLNAPAPSAP